MKGRKLLDVNYSVKAERQLAHVYTYIAQNQSIERAVKVKDAILDAVDKIPNNPYAHPVDPYKVPPSKSVRRLIVGKTYLVTFRIRKDCILILRIAHTAQNPQKLRIK